MTINTELQAARSRVAEAIRAEDAARAALAIAEHQAYSDALQLIADEVRDSAAQPDPDGERGYEALGNIGLVLEGIGISPTPKPTAGQR